MKIKIIGDSASNLYTLTDVEYECAPLKIITDEKEYVDDANLNIAAMVWDLQSYHGRSSTACPSPQDWLDAFQDKPYVFCIAITSNLSLAEIGNRYGERVADRVREMAEIITIKGNSYR